MIFKKSIQMEDSVTIDDKDFFREATRRICGSQEIDTALWNFFIYMRESIPADIIFVLDYDRTLGVAEIIAMADVHGGKITSIKIQTSPEVHKVTNETITANERDQSPLIMVTDHISEHPTMRALVGEIVDDPDYAMLGVGPKPWMTSTGIFIGTNSKEKYTAEHVRLFTLLSEPIAIAISNYLRYREVLRLKDILLDDNRYLQQELRQQSGEEIVGANFGLKQVMEMVHQVSPLLSPVLLLGETGVGKEIIATAIHNLSPRRNGPLIKVNCGAIPDSLMDSELFGHEKGAFTGALFQSGTIFLDEIGELTSGAQIRLLRVLQEKEIERVGGTAPIPVDIRVIAATHRNLEAMLADGKFREDLYFRLRVFPIVIPPLRDRRADIPALVQHFIMKKSREMGLAKIPTSSPDFLDKLSHYHWPGNVRELQNTIEHALIVSKNKPLLFDNINEVRYQEKTMMPVMVNDTLYDFDELQRQHFIKALVITGGRVGGDKGAAQLLKMNPSTLRAKMRKLGIPFGRQAQKSR